jgi:nucleotide-binding universal stress UspA family protein
LKNILLAVDLKSSDQHLVDYAATLAEKFNSKIWIVHVAAPDPDFVGYDVGPTYIRDVRAEELRTEHRKLQQLAENFEASSIESESLLIQGPTVDILKEEITKLHIDLLIMGARHHGVLYEVFVGHTSVKIIKDIPIPVLIVPLPYEK